MFRLTNEGLHLINDDYLIEYLKINYHIYIYAKPGTNIPFYELSFLLYKAILYHFNDFILKFEDTSIINKINLYKINITKATDIKSINELITELIKKLTQIDITTKKEVIKRIDIAGAPDIKKKLINYINSIVDIYTTTITNKYKKIKILTSEINRYERYGGSIGYKSTHKKVNIMNNEKVIERVIYIDNDKNKFIKLNKNYLQLSTFKYNKKNKYYYHK
jgi:hypothetical protein